MKSLLDPSFDYAPSDSTDIHRTFERVWRELGEREIEDEEVRGNSLWLECNGDLVDAASVLVVGKRASKLGVEMVHFVCPRCKQRHESLTFG